MGDKKTGGRTLRCIGRLDTRDALVSALHVHPRREEVAVAVGGRTHVFRVYDDATRLKPLVSFQTDFSAAAGYQLTSVVRFGQHVLGAAGEDGYVRLWYYPSLEPLVVYQQKHNKSVNTLDFNTNGTLVCVMNSIVAVAVVVVGCEQRLMCDV